MSQGRSKPAGPHRLRKQVTEAEKGPLEIRGKKGKGTTSGGIGSGHALKRESVPNLFVLIATSYFEMYMCHNIFSYFTFKRTSTCLLPLRK